MQRYKYIFWLSLFIIGSVAFALSRTTQHAHAHSASFIYRPGLEPTSLSRQQKINGDATTYLKTTGVPYSYYYEPLSDKMPLAPAIAADAQVIPSASLLKVFTVMSLYKLVENNEASLDRSLVLQSSWIDSGFGQLWKKGAGARITLREAVRLSLVDSDNTAINAVRFVVEQDGDDEFEVVRAAHFHYFQDGQGIDYTTAQNYASVLDCLYRSCYLTKIDSNAILALLGESRFAGIINGVPWSTVPVAHKIGETTHSYADCGIVYDPRHPYILCIMLDAPAPTSIPIMSRVSTMVYESMKTN